MQGSQNSPVSVAIYRSPVSTSREWQLEKQLNNSENAWLITPACLRLGDKLENTEENVCTCTTLALKLGIYNYRWLCILLNWDRFA